MFDFNKMKQNRRELIKNLPRNFCFGAEIGVRDGWFSKYILDNTEMFLYSIDPWVNNAELTHANIHYNSCKTRLGEYAERSIMIKDVSENAYRQFDNGFFDFVYIDALHDYHSVKRDVSLWYSKLKIGGILAGHDYNPTKWPGVCDAVEEFAMKENLFLHLVLPNTEDGYSNDGRSEFDGREMSWFCVKK